VVVCDVCGKPATERITFKAGGLHAFIQNLRRGFYDLGTDGRSATRVADAFSELALAI
jgi:hypothetical protein